MVSDDVMANPDIKKMLADAKYPSKTKQAFNFTLTEMKKKQIAPNHTQLLVLANHIGEMVTRSTERRKLTAVDPKLFSQVSQTAMEIAESVTARIGHLAESEKYVLSVHFEVAEQKA